MMFSPNLLSYGAFLSAAISAILTVIAATRRNGRAATTFSAMMASLTVYSLGSGFEFMSLSLRTALLWTHVEYVGISFIPLTLVLFGLDFTSALTPKRRPLIVGLAALCVITLVMQETTELHRLFYVSPRLASAGAVRMVTFDRGPFYLLFQACLAAAMLYTLLLISRQAVHHSGDRRKQSIILDGGLLIAVLGYCLYIAHLTPNRLDMTPIFLALSGILIAYGLFRYHILSFTPFTRHQVFDAMREGGIILDNEDHLVGFNGAARKTFPELSEHRLGESIAAVLPGDSALVEFAHSGDLRRIELFVTVSGARRCYDATLSYLRARRGWRLGKVIILNDTTVQFELARELKELAIRDPLTQLFSRRHFFELAVTEMERARRSRRAAAVIMVDLDHFKLVNDNFGHQAGDLVLSESARRFRETLRTSDILCRYGGEEFLLFLPETDLATAHTVAERMRTILETHRVAVGGTPLCVTGSFGVASLDVVVGESIDELVGMADAALYRAKMSGRNRVELAATR